MNRLQSTALSVLVSIFAIAGYAQTERSATANPQQDDVSALREQLEQTRLQLNQSETQIRELRSMMERMQGQLDAMAQKQGTGAAADGTPQATSQANITSEDWELLNAKVEEHQQVKVESASKFKVKLSGMLLMTAFSDAGSVDNLDVPSYALLRPFGAPHGAGGASLRQSILGLSAVGPSLMGAHTSADLQLDFYGGTASGYSQFSSGLARLRLARLRFDWEKTSLIGGLDYSFFSPNSPTSYMSIAEPAFSSAGNLWTWVPTVRVEQRQKIGPAQLKIEAGLLDYAAYGGRVQSFRYATAGESSRQPAYSLRISANRPGEDKPLSIGFAGIYVPQRFVGGKDVSGWGGTMDWRVPITTHAEITGEFFTGRGINGFGGTTLGQLPTTDIHYTYMGARDIATLLSLGGWSQLKVRVNNKNEFNAAAGYGGFKSGDLRQLSFIDTYLQAIPARNQSMFANYILRPRSDLLFSVEYRHLRTINVTGILATADQVGVAAGFLF